MTFCAVLKTITFNLKTDLATFWANIGKFGYLFIPTSGHTGANLVLNYSTVKSCITIGCGKS